MLLIVLLSLISPSFGDVCKGSIVDTFLAEYDYTIRPGPGEEATVVIINLDVRHVSMEEEKAEMIMLADLNMSWNDSRLAWNEVEWNCSTIMVDVDRIWKPPVDAGGSGISDIFARVNPDGLVVVTQRLQHNCPLELDFHNWPQDSQKAEFPFISQVRTEDIIFALGDNKFLTLHESGSWEVGGVKEQVIEWNGRSAAIWTITVIRRQPALVLAARSIIACSSVLVLATLMMAPAQRAMLALAAVLCNSIWLSSCVVRLPPTKGAPVCVSIVAALTSIAAVSALSGCAYNSAPQRFVVGLLAKFKVMNGLYGEVVKTLDLIFCSILLLAVIIVLLVYVCA